MNPTDVKFTIFDISGRRVTELNLGKQEVGKHNFIFNGDNLSSGVYFYKIEAGDFKDTKSMILIK
jgi:flagellar hook assembly protein FlgD